MLRPLCGSRETATTTPQVSVFCYLHRVPAVTARGKRPAPFRTRKLSPSAPMVLPWRRGGRVGHRRTHTTDERPTLIEGRPFVRGGTIPSERASRLPRRPGGQLLAAEPPGSPASTRTPSRMRSPLFAHRRAMCTTPKARRPRRSRRWNRTGTPARTAQQRCVTVRAGVIGATNRAGSCRPLRRHESLVSRRRRP